MFLRGGFTATGSGDGGAVRLSGAHIGGHLDCSGAELRNDSGPALIADGLQVGQAMFLSGGFTATGSGDDGAVRLVGAHIGGQLGCAGAELRNDSGPALVADSLQVGQDMYLTSGFTAIGGGDDVAVDLTGARVGGAFLFDPARLEHAADPHRRLAVDGLTYAGVPERSLPGAGWSCCGWHPQLCCAAVSAAGRRVPGAGRRPAGPPDLDGPTRRPARPRPTRAGRSGGGAGSPRSPSAMATSPGGRCGSSPRWWRVSCVLAVVLGSHGALAQTDKTAPPGQPCTVVQQVSVGLDLNLPVGTSVARAACDLTTDSASATAAWLTAAAGCCGYWRGCSRRCSSLASPAPSARHDLCAVAVLSVKALGQDRKPTGGSGICQFRLSSARA